MVDVVINANLAVKWVIPQSHSEQAERLFEDTISARDRVVGPPILHSEVLNAIYQHYRPWVRAIEDYASPTR